MARDPENPWRGARVLVTGASGFLGRAVLRACIARGAHVAALVRDPARLPPGPAIPVLRADGTRTGACAEALREWPADLVVHLAGYGVAKDERDAGTMARMNADLPGELAAALADGPGTRWPGVRLLHTGSAFEYGAATVPLDESTAPAPTTDYGRTKLRGTEAVLRVARMRALPALVARPFTVFGVGERPGRLFPTLLAARGHGEDVALSHGLQQRDFVLVDDVAEALLGLAMAPAADVVAARPPYDRGVVNVASGRLHSVREFALAAARALGIEPARLRFGAVPQLAEEMPHPPVPVHRLTAVLGRPLPHDLDDLMRRAVAGVGLGP